MDGDEPDNSGVYMKAGTMSIEPSICNILEKASIMNSTNEEIVNKSLVKQSTITKGNTATIRIEATRSIDTQNNISSKTDMENPNNDHFDIEKGERKTSDELVSDLMESLTTDSIATEGVTRNTPVDSTPVAEATIKTTEAEKLNSENKETPKSDVIESLTTDVIANNLDVSSKSDSICTHVVQPIITNSDAANAVGSKVESSLAETAAESAIRASEAEIAVGSNVESNPEQDAAKNVIESSIKSSGAENTDSENKKDLRFNSDTLVEIENANITSSFDNDDICVLERDKDNNKDKQFSSNPKSVSSTRHLSLMPSNSGSDISPGRRQTESNIKFSNKRRGSENQTTDIRRVISSVQQSTRSGFGGTADFEDKKPSLTPSERLKSRLETGSKPHPLIILPDDGKFWCDPPHDKHGASNQQYFLSCFDMDKPWKEIYGDTYDIVVNPNEVAAHAYVTNFSQVQGTCKIFNFQVI